MAAAVVAFAALAQLPRTAAQPNVNCSLRYHSFYQSDVASQNGSLNVIFTANTTQILAAAAAVPRVGVLYDITGSLWVARPPVNNSYFGITLRSDYASAVALAWNTTVAPLVAQGLIFGFWMG